MLTSTDYASTSHPPSGTMPPEWERALEVFLDAIDREEAERAGYPDNEWERASYGA